MRLVIKQSGRFTYLYAIEGYRTDDGKSTTKVVEKFGTVEELSEKLDGADLKAYIQKGEQRSYNGGYLFLQKIYHELGLDYICKKIAKKHKLVRYDLSGILSMLVYTRILYPGSKRSSLEDAKKFFEQPECTLEQVYRALSLLATEVELSLLIAAVDLVELVEAVVPSLPISNRMGKESGGISPTLSFLIFSIVVLIDLLSLFLFILFKIPSEIC